MYRELPVEEAYHIQTGGPLIMIASVSEDGTADVMTAAWNAPFDTDQPLVVLDKATPPRRTSSRPAAMSYASSPMRTRNQPSPPAPARGAMSATSSRRRAFLEKVGEARPQGA